MFQLQIQQQSLLPQPDLERSLQTDDEVDAALNDLQVTLEGSTLSDTTDITQTPELRNYMRFFKYDLCLNFVGFGDFVLRCMEGGYRLL